MDDNAVCSSRLLDPANTQQFDDFKKCYGEILYRWGLREKRAEVLKFVSCPPDPHKGIGESLLRSALAARAETRFCLRGLGTCRQQVG